MVLCFVVDCNHRTVRNTCHFYRFPKDKKKRDLWTLLTRRADKVPTNDSRLCSCHFVDGKKWNNPTIFSKRKKPVSSSCACCKSFTKDNRYRRKQVKPMQRNNWVPSHFSELCSRQYPEKMIDKTAASCVRLQESAAPGISDDIPSIPMQKEIKQESHEENPESFVSNSIPENNSFNQVNIKVEEPWEESTNNCVSEPREESTNNCVSEPREENTNNCVPESREENLNNCVSDNVTESSQVTTQDVESLESCKYIQSNSSQKASNTVVKKTTESINTSMFQGPLKINKREEIFGHFVACELSALCENSELYLRTKQSILNVFMEAHFKQITSNSMTTS